MNQYSTGPLKKHCFSQNVDLLTLFFTSYFVAKANNEASDGEYRRQADRNYPGLSEWSQILLYESFKAEYLLQLWSKKERSEDQKNVQRNGTF